MNISIIGMGMCDSDKLTAEAKQAVHEAGIIIGAERLLQTLPDSCTQLRLQAVAAEDILNLIRLNQNQKIAVLMSGDTGFYSGAKKLIEALPAEAVRLIPGISSVQYFASKLRRPWQDWKLVSAHGTTCDVAGHVRDNRETFFLTGGQLTVQTICQLLTHAGFGNVSVSVGENLGSTAELLKSGTAASFAQTAHAPLAVMLVDNTTPRQLVSYGFPDDSFIRGDIPMTKSEVRSVVLSKLRLRDNDVVYDIGAGTGSVSVESALLVNNGHVYAFEREDAGCRLIRENANKLCVSNLTVVSGEAPETFAGFPVPDVAFIGGSGGNLEEILKTLLSTNPQIRLVVSAVALETVAQLSSLFLRLPLSDVEAIQLSVSRARPLGEYHLMTAQNPVFIFSGTGRHE